MGINFIIYPKPIQTWLKLLREARGRRPLPATPSEDTPSEAKLTELVELTELTIKPIGQSETSKKSEAKKPEADKIDITK